MSLLLDHPHIKHWQIGTTMRYVSPSSTFIEDAYRKAVSAVLAELECCRPFRVGVAASLPVSVCMM